MATTGIGRMRDLIISMQQKLDPNVAVVLLTVTGTSPAAELYILDKKKGTMHTVQTFTTIRDMNRWAMRPDLERIMAEFL